MNYKTKTTLKKYFPFIVLAVVGAVAYFIKQGKLNNPFKFN